MDYIRSTPPASLPHLNFRLRQPTALDGAAVHALVSRCPPLDANSLYCNLLQCSMFSSTCVVAERDHEIAGFVSAFIAPGAANTLFIWQIAVAPEARGHGLATTMLLSLLAHPACERVDQLQTSITPNNRASWALFEALSKTLNARLSSQVLFGSDIHFGKQHETEMLVSIGSFSPNIARKAAPRPQPTTA